MPEEQEPGDEGGGGPPTQEEIQRTLGWIKIRFKRYYRNARIHLPERFLRREWGFLYLDGGRFERHIGFRHRDELARYLRSNGPEHAYYSTAYYRTPGARTMAEKDWMGADLIFDLDADHLEGADELPYQEQVERVKDEAKWVLEEFVLDHLGFDEEHVHLVFSGNRGYHIHVTDPRVRDLGSQERREIVDYVTGLGLDIENLVLEKAFSQDRFGHPEKTRLLPPPDTPGWRGLIAEKFIELVEDIVELPHEEAVDKLQTYDGVGPKTAEKFLRKVQETRWLETHGLSGVEGFEGMNVYNFPPSALRGLVPQSHLESEGEADEPVTSDIKRLIRLPGSVHGKSGLRVTPIPLHGLDDFDPFRDAVAFGDDPVEVKVTNPETFRLDGDTYEPEPGVQELPEKAAMFLMLRRNALKA